jgi:hypothetical protein
MEKVVEELVMVSLLALQLQQEVLMFLLVGKP